MCLPDALEVATVEKILEVARTAEPNSERLLKELFEMSQLK